MLPSSRATIPGMPKRKAWFWALRRERARSGELPGGWHYGRELGFTGEAAKIAVSAGGYRIRPPRKWDAPNAYNHLNATCGYLAMIVKRSYLWASERGDEKAIAILEATCEGLAGYLLLALDTVRRDMGDRGCEVEELETSAMPGDEWEFRRPPDDGEFDCLGPQPPRMHLAPPGDGTVDWLPRLPEIRLECGPPGGEGS